MPTHYSTPDYPAETEPKSRFYPNQESQTRPSIPSAPIPDIFPQMSSAPGAQQFPVPSPSTAARRIPSKQNNGDASYLMHRHPILLQRLYDAADSHLSSYRINDFIYDAYPDYLSLRLMRDRLLRENRTLTEEFLHAGCGTEWLNLLTDTVLSELLCRKRCSYRKPSGDANTTSVRSASLS